jgi:type II secretion system protein I
MRLGLKKLVERYDLNVNFNEYGFTLIEVLVAVVIMGLALPLLLEGFSLVLDSTSRAYEETFATILAREKLNEVCLSLSQESEGDVIDKGKRFHWEVMKKPGDEVFVVVTWQGRRSMRKYEVATLHRKERSFYE